MDECPACGLEYEGTPDNCPYCHYEFPERPKSVGAVAWLMAALLIVPVVWAVSRLF